MTNTEHVYANEDLARAARRRFIDVGRTVSLIAGDYRNGRDVFVFDVATPAPAPTRVRSSTTDTQGNVHEACPVCGYVQVWASARCVECGA